jgi:hypothetical protein
MPVLTILVMPLQRTKEIKRRRRRRKSLAKLRVKFKGARTELARNKLLDKAFKISPSAVLE